MKIIISPWPREQFLLLQDSSSLHKGFLLGTTLGHTTIISHILPINFFPGDPGNTYEKIFHRVGERLLGVYSIGEPPPWNEWFWMDLAAVISSPEAPIRFYQFQANKSLLFVGETEPLILPGSGNTGE